MTTATIIINTTTQPSGISYAWDRDYDLQTKEEVVDFYRKYKDRFVNKKRELDRLEEMLNKMEELAAKDGIELESKNTQNKRKRKK